MVNTSPLKAIRAKCLNCCCDQPGEVKNCTSTSCSLYDFRMGKNPFRKKREYTDEERQAMRERLSKNRL